jgi:hypothetical protein
MNNGSRTWRVVLEVPFSPSTDFLGPGETRRWKGGYSEADARALVKKIKTDKEFSASGLDVFVEPELNEKKSN